MSTKTKFYKIITGLLLFSSVSVAQSNSRLLEFTLNHLTGSGVVAGSGFGPRTTDQVVFFDKDRHNDGKFDHQNAMPTPIIAPFISATFSFENQQYTGFTYGAGSSYPISSGLVFGAAPSSAFGGAPPQQVTPLNSYDILGTFNGGGGPKNGMYMSNYGATPAAIYPATPLGTGIDAQGLYPSNATDANGGVQVFTAAQRMFDLGNPAGTADRYYYGDLVITFSRFVNDPVIHIAGLGGSYRYSIAGGNPFNVADWRSTFFSAELELVGPGVLTKMAGNQFLNISGKNILNNAITPNGESADVGNVALPNWNNFGAASGSVRVGGAAVRTLRFKVWLRGSNANANPNNFNWSAPASASGGFREPLTGDTWGIGISLAQAQLIPLPSTGVHLEGALNGNDVQLSWKTQTEINSENFEIERSIDGTNFTAIGTKAAAGNSSTQVSYDFMDRNMTASIYYYRLRLNDIDARYTYSNIVTIRKTGGGKGIRVYPNPAVDNVSLEFNNAKGNYSIRMYNQAGQEVMNKVANIQYNVQTIGLERGNLAAGYYMIQISNNNDGSVRSEKVIFQ